jgi:hypothetical protein
LYEYLDQHGASLSLGVRSPRLLVVPERREGWSIREITSLRGELLRVGGVAGVAELRFDREGWMRCQAGRRISSELASHLYKRVEVTGEAVREPNHQTLTSFKITSFRSVPEKGPAAALSRLHAIVGDSLDDLDPIEHLRELRG